MFDIVIKGGVALLAGLAYFMQYDWAVTALTVFAVFITGVTLIALAALHIIAPNILPEAIKKTGNKKIPDPMVVVWCFTFVMAMLSGHFVLAVASAISVGLYIGFRIWKWKLSV